MADYQYIQEELQSVFKHVFKNRTIILTDNTSAKDIEGWDSMTHMMLINEIEKQFKVTFTLNEVMKFSKVGDIIATLADKL